MNRNLALHTSSPSSHLIDMNYLRVHCAVLDPIRHLPSVQGPLFCHSQKIRQLFNDADRFLVIH